MTRSAIALAATVALLALTGCGSQERDLKGVKFSNVQKAQGFNNVDQHPNLVRFCVDGIAFISTTREGTGVVRIPEWDAPYCGYRIK